MESVLVTGGLGIIGAFVCRAVLASGRKPVIYDAGSNTRLIADIAGDCIIESGDVCDLPRLTALVQEHAPIAIAHFAGLPGPRVETYPWSALQVNLLGAVTTFECARLLGVPRVVFASSKSVYGRVRDRHGHPNYEPVPEEHPLNPIRHYSKLKRSTEDIAAHYAGLYGLDIVGLRFGSVFGPGKSGLHANVSPVVALIESAIANRPFHIESGGAQHDDLCYCGEAANGVVAALDSAVRPGRFQAYNISSGELISLREMISVLRDLYAGWEGSAGDGMDYRRSGVADYFLMDTTKAAREIGFRPRYTFRTAVIDYAEKLSRLRGLVP